MWKFFILIVYIRAESSGNWCEVSLQKSNKKNKNQVSNPCLKIFKILGRKRKKL